MGRTDRLALTTTQTILDGVTDRADLTALHDERLMTHQPKTWRPGITQVSTWHEFAGVEMIVRVDTTLVVLEGQQFRFSQKFILGQTNAVLTRNHAIEIARDLHDAHNGLIGLAQHFIVVRVHRYVGVHVAVARMHMQGDKYTAFEYAVMDGLHFGHDGCEIRAAKHAGQITEHLGFPRNTQGTILHNIE